MINMRENINMDNEIELRIKEIREVLFQYEIGRLMQLIPDLVAILLKSPGIDTAAVKKYTLLVFDALKKQDYLLAVDILTYEILPLQQQKGEIR